MTMLPKFAVLALVLVAAAPAQATLIDFTSSNLNPVTVESVSATVTGSGPLTWTAFDGNAFAEPCVSGSLACDNDGIGVGDDEVSYRSEWLVVTFSQIIDITDIHLFDLFGVNDDAQGNPAEVARVQFRDAYFNVIDLWTLTGTAAPGTLSGYATSSGLVNGVSSIRFSTSQSSYRDNTDFAVAGIEFVSVVSVPEPTTLTLLGGGLLVFGLMRRRRQNA